MQDSGVGKSSMLFDSVMTLIPQGHEKPLRVGIYNAAALLFLSCVAYMVLQVYHMVLQPFTQPLLWAILCGSVLHPMKWAFASTMRSWLADVQKSSTPTSVQIALVPLGLLKMLFVHVWELKARFFSMFIMVTVVFFSVAFGQYLCPWTLWETCLSGLEMASSPFIFFASLSRITVLMLLICYVSLLVSYQFLPGRARDVFPYFSIFVFLVTLCSISNTFGTWRFPLAGFILILSLIGAYYELRDFHAELREDREAMEGSSFEEKKVTHLGVPGGVPEHLVPTPSISGRRSPTMLVEEDEESELSQEPAATSTPLTGITEQQSTAFSTLVKRRAQAVKEEAEGDGSPSISLAVPQRRDARGKGEDAGGRKPKRGSAASQKGDAEGTDDSEGNSYIYGVIWASILLFLWRHPAWFSLLPIPFVFSVIKYIGAYFEIWDFISSQWNTLSKNASFTALRYREVVAPRCIRLPLRALKRGDRALAFALEDYVDLISTVAVIVLVLIILTCSFIWTALAVYGEGSYLVDVSGRAINETITRNSEFLPAGFYDMIQQQSHMVHGYGREWISQLVKQVSGQGDPEKSQQLEQEVLVFWDKIYAEYVRYMATPSTLEKNLSESLPAPDEGYSDSELEGGGPGNDTETEDDSGWSESYKKLTRSMSFHTSINLIRNNLDVVQSVSETTFGILKENLHLAASTFTLLFSLLLGGGSAVLNILLNFIIFATSLFYILNASGEYYMPVDLIASFTPRHTTKYSVAMEESVYAVFLVTLRMAIFNGIWTWLIHSALSVQLVCIPSVLAGIFSAVPLVGTYFAAIPGIIELWLIEERPYAAILLLIAQMFPIYFVNDEFYKGIKGGIHPYIIGLSVMGGVLCIGVQGAILGPVLLCSLLIALNIYKGAIKSSPWETIQERMRGRAFNRAMSTPPSSSPSAPLAPLFPRKSSPTLRRPSS